MSKVTEVSQGRSCYQDEWVGFLFSDICLSNTTKRNVMLLNNVKLNKNLIIKISNLIRSNVH